MPAFSLALSMKGRRQLGSLVRKLLSGAALNNVIILQDLHLATIVECRRKKKQLIQEENDALHFLREAGSLTDEQIDAEIMRRMY